MPVAPPTPETRWRCAACGNLTRFDVVRTRRLREYVHADLAGEPVIEESETLSEVVEHVTCRWCGAVDQVELVPRPDTATAGMAPPDTGAAADAGPPPTVADAAAAASGAVAGAAAAAAAGAVTDAAAVASGAVAGAATGEAVAAPPLP